MKLSEAIRLGSLLVPSPKKLDIRACAITMAIKATGDISAEQVPADRYGELLRRWPWLEQWQGHCPQCRETLSGYSIVYRPFDDHIIKGQMTIEQLADWIATIEPQELPETEVPDVHLRDLQEVKSA